MKKEMEKMDISVFAEKSRAYCQKFSSREVCISRKMGRNNSLKWGLYLKPDESGITPIIQLRGYYEDFLEGEFNDERSIFEDILIKLESENHKTAFEADLLTCMKGIYDAHTILDNVQAELMNYEENIILLSEVPHRRFLDLAVCYYYPLRNEASFRLTNAFIASIDLTEEDLYQAAMKNMHKQNIHVKSIFEILCEQTGEEYMDKNRQEAPEMLVITNESSVKGASAILRKDALDFASCRLGTHKLFVIPSSIHECLVVPERFPDDAMNIKGMIFDVNNTVVNDDEKLSYNLYRYNSTTTEWEVL